MLILLDRFMLVFGALALISGFVLPTILPELANISTLVFMALGIVVLAARPTSRRVFLEPAVYLPLLACGLLTVALLLTAQSPMHVLAIFVLAPIIFAGALAGLWSQLAPPLSPTLIGAVALLGTTGGLLIAAYDVVILGHERGGGLVNNPIHLAALTMTLGFIAVVGIFGSNRWWRPVFLLGPIFALATTLLSGSRGPVLAFVPLFVAAIAALSILLLPRKHLPVSILGAIALIIAGGLGLLASGFGARLASVGQLFDLAVSGSTSDGSIGERLYLYQSAWNAFWASPWYGFGLLDYTTSAAQYAPSGPVQWPPSGHLHSDIADFAVIGGLVGLVSYALLLAAPLVSAFKARGPWRGPIIYLGTTLPCGYFAMGLTNAMIGILTQTTMYSVTLALIAVLSVQAVSSESAMSDRRLYRHRAVFLSRQE